MGLIKDLFFGGAERDAARMQAASGREAVNVVEPAVNESIAQLNPYRGIGLRAINPLLREATNTAPGSAQYALTDSVLNGRGPTAADARLLSEINSGPDTSVSTVLRNRVFSGGSRAADDAVFNFISNAPGNDVERENIIREVNNQAAAAGKRFSGGRDLELGRQLTAEQNRYRGQRISELLSAAENARAGRAASLNELFGLAENERAARESRLGELFGLTGQQRDDRARGINELLQLFGVQEGNREGNFNRLLDVVGIGANATNAANSLRVGGAGAVSDLITGVGNANAAGRVAGANATRGTLNSILDTVLAVKGF